MALDFGIFPGQDRKFQTADYRSAGSHQAENIKTRTSTANNNYEDLHTVTTGKTYYISAIMLTTTSSTNIQIYVATGGSGSETDILGAATNVTTPILMALPTPVKVASGTRISAKGDGTSEKIYVLIGWEE